jgi:WD40 repeat protein
MQAHSRLFCSLISLVVFLPAGLHSAAPPAGKDEDCLPAGALCLLGCGGLRHEDRIRAVAFSADGGTLLAGSADGAVRRWSTRSGVQRSALPLPNTITWATAFSRDGKLLATSENAMSGHPILIRDAKSGKVIRQFTDAPNLMWTLAFSPDGRTLAGGGNGTVVCTWDTTTGKRLHTFTGHTAVIRGVAFSPDGKILVSGSDREVRLWNPATGKGKEAAVGSGKLEGRGAESIVFSRDGRFVAVTRDRNPLEVYDAATRRLLRSFKGHAGCLQTVAVSPNGKLIAGCDGVAVQLWDFASGRLLRRWPGRWEFGADALAFSPDSKLLASVVYNVIHLWDTTTGEELFPRVVDQGPVRLVQLSRDGRTLAAAGGKAVSLWDLIAPTARPRLCGTCHRASGCTGAPTCPRSDGRCTSASAARCCTCGRRPPDCGRSTATRERSVCCGKQTRKTVRRLVPASPPMARNC